MYKDNDVKYYSNFILISYFRFPLEGKADERQKFSRKTDNGEESAPTMDFPQSKELPLNKKDSDSSDITSNSLSQELASIVDVSYILSLYVDTEYFNQLYFLNPIKNIFRLMKEKWMF